MKIACSDDTWNGGGSGTGEAVYAVSPSRLTKVECSLSISSYGESDVMKFVSLSFIGQRGVRRSVVSSAPPYGLSDGDAPLIRVEDSPIIGRLLISAPHLQSIRILNRKKGLLKLSLKFSAGNCTQPPVHHTASLTPSPGSSRRCKNPSCSANPPKAASLERSKLPSRSR